MNFQCWEEMHCETCRKHLGFAEGPDLTAAPDYYCDDCAKNARGYSMATEERPLLENKPRSITKC